jgi:methionyl-tRNA formyltransferase
MKIAVFAYNFVHRKSQDVLVRLFLEGYQVHTVIACDPVKLDIPSSSIRTKLRGHAVLHPRDVARRVGASYHVMAHNSSECEALLREEGFDVGVIAGARILAPEVIGPFRAGVVNFHPGLIPESRGLDALLWSIYRDIPLGVTAHLIDRRIDAGRILLREFIRVHPDDSLVDLSERLYDRQLEMLARSVEAAAAGEAIDVDLSAPYNRKMPAELEREVISLLPAYLERHSRREADASPPPSLQPQPAAHTVRGHE